MEDREIELESQIAELLKALNKVREYEDIYGNKESLKVKKQRFD
ncbi:hypothetical protein AB4114_29730 [Paenibacillus sp. 2RAB27]